MFKLGDAPLNEAPKFVIKTLLQSFTSKKLSVYRTQFKSVFDEIDSSFDEVLELFEEFYNRFDISPTLKIIVENLELAGHSKESSWVQDLMADSFVEDYADDADFFAALEQAEADKALNETYTAMQKMQVGLAQRTKVGSQGIVTPVDEFLTFAHQMKSGLQRFDSSTSSYLWGSGDKGQGTSLEVIYDQIKTKADTGDAFFFNCGLSAFDDVQFKDGDLIIYGAFTSHGKALSISTPIPTPSGWTTMNDLKIGEIIFSDTGEQCKIIAITEVMYDRPCYKVTFSDSTSIIADESHQWLTMTAEDRRKGQLGSIKTTKEIQNTILKSQGRLNHSISTNKSLHCQYTNLPIDPYLYGVWCGDGASLHATITIGEPEVVSLVTKAAQGHGWEVKKYGNSITFGISGGMQATLRQMEVLGNKRIPQNYLRASVQQRIALLRGLMDSDGYVSKIGDCEFTTIHKTIAESVAELIRSLGCKVNIREGDAKLNGKFISKKYRLIFCPPFQVFKLSRKARVLTEANAKKVHHKVAKNQKHYIQSVEFIGSVPVRCIEVDSPSKLFLCGERMVPTHNSVLLRHNAYRQAVTYGRNVAFFTREMSHDYNRIMFSLIHANNKEIFPGTPKISYDKVSKGILNDEEYDFFLNVADHDIRNNTNYGTLYIDQPNKSRYRLTDMEAKLVELESKMPIHCCVVDYLLLFYPLASDKGAPQRQDYNEMIKAYKTICLTHKSSSGNDAPMLGFTAAQISRGGLAECEKQEGRYEISAFREYTELEASADILFTCYLPKKLKDLSKIAIQNVKNRTGVTLSDPVEIDIDLRHGLTLSDRGARNDDKYREILEGISLG